MSSSQVPVTFLAGFSPRAGALGLLAFPYQLESRAEFCRFFTLIDGQWGASDLAYQGKALASLVDASRNYRAWWILGRNGEISELRGGSARHDEQIPHAGLGRAGARGYVETIKTIAGQLYVCGYHRQMYVRKDGEWQSIADEILSEESGVGFLDMDGLGPDRIYAVGWKGEIYCHDGRTWHRDASPTTALLTSVRCLPDGETWICGHDGLVMHGRFNDWQVLDPAGPDGNWYSLDVHEGQIYLAGNGVLARVEEGHKLVKLDPIGQPITTHRLHSCGGALWSIGEDDILVLENGVWREVIHPDNA